MRKLEEDGYINKTQGKQAVVSTHALQYKDGFQWLFNPCIENCVDTIDEIKISAQYQPCGVYVAHELGYKKPGDLMVFTSTDYFSNGRQVANTVTIFDAEYMEKFQLDMNDIEKLGHAISAAFMATLLGIFTGYVLWHPFANKLKRKSAIEVKQKRMMIEGILSVLEGEAPRVIEQKLSSYLTMEERRQISDESGAGGLGKES